MSTQRAENTRCQTRLLLVRARNLRRAHDSLPGLLRELALADLRAVSQVGTQSAPWESSWALTKAARCAAHLLLLRFVARGARNVAGAAARRRERRARARSCWTRMQSRRRRQARSLAAAACQRHHRAGQGRGAKRHALHLSASLDGAPSACAFLPCSTAASIGGAEAGAGGVEVDRGLDSPRYSIGKITLEAYDTRTTTQRYRFTQAGPWFMVVARRRTSSWWAGGPHSD